MSKRPWMPLNIADYLADTGHLSTLEHGAYLLLIMEYWKQGGLPDDERKLAKIARLTAEQWQECRDTLADLFQPGWKHKRVDEELNKASEIIEKRRNAASARHANSKSNAHAEQVHCKSSDTRVPQDTNNTPSSLRSDGGAPKRATRLPADWSLPDEWRQDALDIGLLPSQIDFEADSMRDWSQSASDGARKDWRAMWRNWCRRVVRSTARPRSPPQRETTITVIDSLLEKMDHADADPTAEIEGHQAAALQLPGWQ